MLRKKVEELEAENERLKSNTKELQDKLLTKSSQKKNIVSSDRGNTLHDKKLKVERFCRDVLWLSRLGLLFMEV